MTDKFFAIITNLNGIDSELKQYLEVGSVYNIKRIDVNGDSYSAVCDVCGHSLTLNSENIEVYKTYDAYDIIHYNPLETIQGQNERDA